MAITRVQGTVTRTFFEGKGAEVVEAFKKRDGSEGKTRWAAFFDEPHGLSEGDVIEVSGMHGDKVDQWEKEGQTMHTIKRTLNKARLANGATTSAPAQEPWANTPAANPVASQGESNGFAFDDTVPF